ncbi:unnamed protein product [Brassica oleracea var. botrytis]|uniref:Calcium uniporter protein C-terminal domain-containing protein n=3 Tax=Brassica TaxID=3705 RepID=A0A0D3DI22_BRAOL|nr:unnamed protein product [Brassica napus]VDD41061.1 unnamed protein product [Brassica oleracea]
MVIRRSKSLDKHRLESTEANVTKSIEGLLPLPQIRNPNDPRRKELKELEAINKVIDQKSHSLVRRELQAGHGYMILQTALFMRLTFWELTWDVMEPICFYRKLMEAQDFDAGSTPAPHVQAQPSVKPTSAFTTTRQNPATVTKGVKAQNREKQEDKRCTFVTAHQVALGNRFEALRDQDV